MYDENQRTAPENANNQNYVPRHAAAAPAARHRAMTSKRRAALRRKRRNQLLLLAGAAVLVIVLLILLLTGGGSEDAATEAANAITAAPIAAVSEPEETQLPVGTDAPAALSEADTDDAKIADEAGTALTDVSDADEADAAPQTLAADETNVGTEENSSASTVEASASDVSPDPVRAARASTRPEQKEGFLPVFTSASTEEKIIAITVDDCFQVENLKEIISLAQEYDGKLTLFPIGEQAMREDHAPVIKAAWEAGMEIENHTYTHNGLYKCDDETLAKEIYIDNYALSYILGGEYKCHFLRPRGGDARWDQRIHAYCKQMGYYGIAHWSVLGLSSKLTKQIEPGAILLFHTTDSDLEVLRQLIPALASAGYKMVTLNEMFGYEDNEFTPCEISREMPDVPELEPYEEVYIQLKKGTYSHSVMKLQERLVELGYLDDTPDACYGENTRAAVGKFQKKAGLGADGIAGPETQTALYSDDAPRA